MPQPKQHWKRSRIAPVRAALLACAVVVVAGGASGDDWRHWSNFGKGSWKQLRSTSETLDTDGKVTSRSVTDSEITLINRTERRITLRVANTVQVAGKRFESPPTTVMAGPFGESDGEHATVETLPDHRVEVEGVPYDCERRRVRIVAPASSPFAGKRIVESTSHPRFAIAPLRRVVTLVGPTEETISTTTSEIVAVNLPHNVLSETVPATFVRTVHKNHKITSTTLSACCEEIPGHVVLASTKELDAQGRVIRRNTLEMLDYEVVQDDRGPIVTRGQHRRSERRARRQP